MKKIICLVLGVFLSCACFASCNEDAPQEKPVTPPTYVEPTPNSDIVSATINKVEGKTLNLVYNNTSIQKKVIKGSYIDGYTSSRIIEDKAIVGWSTSQNGGAYTSKIEDDLTLYAVLGDYVKYSHTKTEENAYTVTVKASANEKAFFMDFNDIKAIDVQTQADLDEQVEIAKQEKEAQALAKKLADKREANDDDTLELTPEEIQEVKDELYAQDPYYGVDVRFTAEMTKKFTLSVENSIEYIYIKGVSGCEIDLQLNTFIRQKPLCVTLDNANIHSTASKAVFDFTNVIGATSVVEAVGSSKISCKNYSAGVLANEGSVSITADGVSSLEIIGGNNDGEYAGTAVNAKKLLINNLTLSAKGGTNVGGQGGVSILSSTELSLVQCSVSAVGGNGKTGGYSLSYAKDAVMNLVPNSFVFTGLGGKGETEEKNGKDFKFSYLGYTD